MRVEGAADMRHLMDGLAEAAAVPQQQGGPRRGAPQQQQQQRQQQAGGPRQASRLEGPDGQPLEAIQDGGGRLLRARRQQHFSDASLSEFRRVTLPTTCLPVLSPVPVTSDFEIDGRVPLNANLSDAQSSCAEHRSTSHVCLSLRNRVTCF